ncbi:L,D-transpeptidase family protein [Desulfoscipio gibsoniae]|nr:Ig-like domain-containing protein [Desulfoscipio gibsoniae]
MLLQLTQEKGPQGQLLTFKIDNVPTIIPYIKKSVQGSVRPYAPLELSSETIINNVPSCGPLLLTFNTPVDPKSLKKSIILPTPGHLKAFEFSANGKNYTDYSRWHYTPKKPFKNEATYQIIIKPGLKNLSGSILEKQYKIAFSTAPKLEVIDTNPSNNTKSVQLFQTIEFTLNQEMAAASVKVVEIKDGENVPGKTQVDRKTARFQPARVFLPDHSYKAVLQAKSKAGESINSQLSFTTLDMGKRLWVDVCLGEKHTVTVYQGSKKICSMPASGGRPDAPTPLGYFYTQDHGYSFWSSRFGEGATYWVRLVGQILVHSVPKDSQWKTKEEEHDKLGLPASHGCIRLDESDAKWFYENIPRGTLVIIHT